MGAAAKPIRTIERPQQHPRPPRRIRARKLLDPQITRDALKQAFVMLRPDIQWSNPVMFVVEIGAVLTLLVIIQALVSTSVSQARRRLIRCAGRAARRPHIVLKPVMSSRRFCPPISDRAIA
jgi:hypothetical protein